MPLPAKTVASTIVSRTVLCAVQTRKEYTHTVQLQKNEDKNSRYYPHRTSDKQKNNTFSPLLTAPPPIRCKIARNESALYNTRTCYPNFAIRIPVLISGDKLSKVCVKMLHPFRTDCCFLSCFLSQHAKHASTICMHACHECVQKNYTF